MIRFHTIFDKYPSFMIRIMKNKKTDMYGCDIMPASRNLGDVSQPNVTFDANVDINRRSFYTGDTINEAYQATMASLFHTSDIEELPDMMTDMFDVLLGLSDASVSGSYLLAGVFSKTDSGVYRASMGYPTNEKAHQNSATLMIEVPEPEMALQCIAGETFGYEAAIAERYKKAIPRFTQIFERALAEEANRHE